MRATQTLEWVGTRDRPFDIGLGRLTLACTALCRWPIEAGKVKSEEATTLGPMPPGLTEHMTAAVNGLRKSGDMEFVSKALLTQAWSQWAINLTIAATSKNGRPPSSAGEASIV